MVNAYTKAGVDVEAGYEVVKRIKKHVKRTNRAGIMSMIGGFGGCFDLSVLNIKEPVLVSGTDGVGTKLLLADQQNKHNTIGIDCVAMCVNDIIAQGAQPLYFLDYIATGKNDPEKLEQVVAGIVEGCVQANAALIGGETAEMPGLYAENEYDLAGFAVGVVEKKHLLTGDKIQEGDLLIGLSASGIHSNGYSLVRKIFFEKNKFTGQETFPELGDKTLSEILLEPTTIYVDALLPLVEQELVNGMAHITGGGFVENIPRMFNETLAAEITLGSWTVLPIFDLIQKYGEIPEQDMYEIFNMGIGMVIAIASEDLSKVQSILTKKSQNHYVIGKVTKKETTAIHFKEVKK